jgi:hypothetical protein
MSPIPKFAIPSVQIITLDPGFPFDAIETDDRRAGPRAVDPNVERSSNFSLIFQ